MTIDKDSSLVAYMQSHTQVLCINEIVNPAILVGIQGASLEQQLQAVQYLALTCIEEDPQKKANYGTCHQTTQADWEVRSMQPSDDRAWIAIAICDLESNTKGSWVLKILWVSTIAAAAQPNLGMLLCP